MSALPKICLEERLALRELEAAASLRTTVFLTFDGTAIAGQEAFGLDRAAQRRFVLRERLGDTVLDRTSLPGKTAAFHGGNHVILTCAVSDAERLVDHQAQGRASEIDFLIAAIDRNLAGAGLYPNTSNGVLTTAGGVSAAKAVDFLFAQRRGRLDRSDRRVNGDGFAGRRSRSVGGQRCEVGQGLAVIGQYAPTLFLRLRDAKSSTSGFCAACECSAPAKTRRLRIC